MSKFIDFNNQIQNNSKVQTAFFEILKENHIKSGSRYVDFDDATILALIPVAKQAGIDFTVAEVKEYFAKGSADELSEDELEGVAGGKDQVFSYDKISGKYYYD